MKQKEEERRKRGGREEGASTEPWQEAGPQRHRVRGQALEAQRKTQGQ